MSSYQHHEHVDTPASRTDRTVTSHRFSPGQVIGGIAGLVMAIVGIVAVVNAGIDNSLNTPLADSFGMSQSAAVGLAEIILGLLLLVSSASIAYRGFMGFLGAISLIAGVVIAAASGDILSDIGAQQSTGWFAVIIGAIAILAAFIPSIVRSSDRTEQSY